MTVTTSITIWQDLAGDHKWRVELLEEQPGTRNLEFGPFDQPNEARAWIAEAVTVPLPDSDEWERTDTPGLRIEFHCVINNEVPA